MRTVTSPELKRMLDQNGDLTLINVLPADSFNLEHIPDSRNIPLKTDRFEHKVEQAAGGKDRRVIVYCASTDCDASPKAARKLEAAGFSNIYDFEGGTKAWKEAGFKLATA